MQRIERRVACGSHRKTWTPARGAHGKRAIERTQYQNAWRRVVTHKRWRTANGVGARKRNGAQRVGASRLLRASSRLAQHGVFLLPRRLSATRKTEV